MRFSCVRTAVVFQYLSVLKADPVESSEVHCTRHVAVSLISIAKKL